MQRGRNTVILTHFFQIHGLARWLRLGGGHLHGSFNLIGIGKALARERIAAEQAPPPLL